MVSERILNTLLIAWLLVILYGIIRQPYDDTDDQVNKVRSGMALYVDHGTGCQYIKGGYFGTMIPRLNERGEHICEVKE